MEAIRTFRLKIKYANGDIYWIEHFNDLMQLDAWLVEEMTRPYWDPSWTSEIYELDDQLNETLVEAP